MYKDSCENTLHAACKSTQLCDFYLQPNGNFWKIVQVVKAILFQQSWLAVCYGNLIVLRDGNFAHRPCQKYGTVEERDDELELLAWEFCIPVNNTSILAKFHGFFLWLSSCFNFYKPVKLSSLSITVIGVV